MPHEAGTASLRRARVRVEVPDRELLLGLLEVHGVPQGPASPALAAAVDAAVATWRATEAEGPGAPGAGADRAAVRATIRDLLRRGRYKPTGRGKPASEYLAQAAARGEFPRIAHAVDALNLTSLESGLPISLLDLDRALALAPGLAPPDDAMLVVRLGRAGERFVFNSAGQELDAEDLWCVAPVGDAPIGTPVKDAMAAKTTPATRDVLAIVWASRRAIDAAALMAVVQRLAERLAGAGKAVALASPPTPPQ